MRLIEELRRKIENYENGYALLGTEIKLRRTKQNKTLEFIAQKTCSVSYLSKVENAGIKPNPKMLEEICKRLKVTKENIETINNSKKLFEGIFKGLYNNDLKPLEDAKKKVEDLGNYRARLMMFLYYVCNNEMKAANRLYKELEKLVSCMMLNDLVVLAYIEILFFYKLCYLDEAYLIIKELESIELPFKYLRPLVLEVKLDLFSLINSNLFLTQVIELKYIYVKDNSYRNLERLEGKIRSYYIRNEYFLLLDLDEQNPNDHDALLFNDIVNQNELHIRSGYSSFAKLLYYAYADVEEFKIQYDTLALKLEERQRLLIDTLYSLHFDDDYCNKIVEVFYPCALALKDEKLINIMQKYAVEALCKSQRYKRITEIFRADSGKRSGWV